MKTRIPVTITLAAMCGSLFAGEIGLMLDVKKLNSSTAVTTTWKSTYSTDRDHAKRVTLGILIRNSLRRERPITVEWYFIGKPTGGGQRFIASEGSQELVIGQGSKTNLVIESDPLTTSVYKSNDGDYASVTGDRFDGYIVRVKENGELLKVAASMKPLEQIGASEDKLSAMKK